MRTNFKKICFRRAYRTPAVRTKGLRTELNFGVSTPVESTFNMGTMTENDYTGLWGDPE